MPPPKVKLHSKIGKARPGPPKIPQNVNTSEYSQASSSSSASTNSLSPEQEEQFQMELYWCIKQLQTALATDKKLSNKLIIEHTKSLNTLMNPSAPMIKKRQVMRLCFGDYRTRMLEDEKKAKKISIKIGESKPSSKSVFFRKAIFNNGENDFKFNFPSPEKETLLSQEGKIITDAPVASKINNLNTTFNKSDNSFRFNFSNNSS